MHEVALAQAVWKQMATEMASHPGCRLLGASLVVGRWSGADPESLEFALGLMAADSEWPAAVVHIRSEPLALRCRSCRHEFEPPEANLACPACGGTGAEPIRGKDVRLESLEIDDSPA
jgi:hydrogenase nickel incorporation protein HypA/HybF